MNFKLIKINQDYYLIDANANNSKKGEVNYDQTTKCIVESDELAHSDCFKVIASTKEHKGCSLLHQNDISVLVANYQYPNIEKIAEEYADFEHDYIPLSAGAKYNRISKRDFLAGFNKAIELGFVCSTVDMSNAVNLAYVSGKDGESRESFNKMMKDYIGTFEKYEWDVEIEMEVNNCDGCKAGIPVDNHGNHRMGKEGGYPDFMGCQKEKYNKPNVNSNGYVKILRIKQKD